MAATPPNTTWNLLLGASVYTADEIRLGYVVGGDADGLYVSEGFLFRRTYTVPLADVDHCADDGVLLKLNVVEGVARQDSYLCIETGELYIQIARRALDRLTAAGAANLLLAKRPRAIIRSVTKLAPNRTEPCFELLPILSSERHPEHRRDVGL